MRTTVIKRRFTNIQTLTAKPRKASEAADGRVKIAATATKRALLPRATGLTKTVWSNRRWRRALANYYLKAPPATTCTAPPESTPHNGAITAEEKRRSTEDESAGDDTFYTFDNAPTGKNQCLVIDKWPLVTTNPLFQWTASACPSTWQWSGRANCPAVWSACPASWWPSFSSSPFSQCSCTWARWASTEFDRGCPFSALSRPVWRRWSPSSAEWRCSCLPGSSRCCSPGWSSSVTFSSGAAPSDDPGAVRSFLKRVIMVKTGNHSKKVVISSPAICWTRLSLKSQYLETRKKTRSCFRERKLLIDSRV